METKKIFKTVDEITEVYKRNGYCAVEYDETSEDTCDINDSPNVIFIFNRDNFGDLFLEVNKKRENDDQYDFCFCYKEYQMYRSSKFFTEAYLLSILEFECCICYEIDKDIHCQSCSKRICVKCLKKLININNICPMCRNEIIRCH